MRIPALTVQNNTLCTDEQKAEAFNKYFQPVFTQSTPGDMVALPVTQPSMKDVEIDVNGVDCLLRQIETSKAVGPNGLVPFVLKNCHGNIAQ